MEEEILDDSEVLETTEEVEEEIVETDEEKEALKKKVEELENKNKQLFERAKKKEEPEKDISNKDLLALANARLEEEDVETVLKWARFENVSVAQALTEETLKGILATRKEFRETAQANNIKSGARGSSVQTGEDLLRKARSTGDVPDSEEGMAKLFQARQAEKLGKR